MPCGGGLEWLVCCGWAVIFGVTAVGLGCYVMFVLFVVSNFVRLLLWLVWDVIVRSWYPDLFIGYCLTTFESGSPVSVSVSASVTV